MMTNNIGFINPNDNVLISPEEIENNRLLSTFLEQEEKKNPTLENRTKEDFVDKNRTPNHFSFRTDMDCLMLVADKINSLDDVKLVINKDKGCYIRTCTRTGEDFLFAYLIDAEDEYYRASDLLDSIYKICVDFVKWFNEKRNNDERPE